MLSKIFLLRAVENATQLVDRQHTFYISYIDKVNFKDHF